MLDGLVIDWIDGCCPVQGEGAVAGCPWFFRARGRGWTFEVTRPAGEGVYYAGGCWGDGEFAAGYMPIEVALRFIEQSSRAFLSTLG